MGVRTRWSIPAIWTTSLAPGATAAEKWQFLLGGQARCAGRTLSLADEVYSCASQTNERNREIARLLARRQRIYSA